MENSIMKEQNEYFIEFTVSDKKIFFNRIQRIYYR